MIARYAIPFFFVMALIVAPVVFALLSRWLAPKKYWKRIALACTLFIYMLAGYGTFCGFQQLEVRHLEYVFDDLPKSFDGYRIVQFSDAHVGSYKGVYADFLQVVIDSIKAQKGDVIVFTGDLENLHPDELQPQLSLLRQLKAKDGVYSILGNHDYPIYQDYDEATKAHCIQQTKLMERKAGWRLLLNEHQVIRRDSDSIVIAGMENWGKVERMPRLGDVKKTLAGVKQQASQGKGVGSPFILMLQHDPSAWREKILPECHAQLTLSGHTHGGQFSLFGWSPVSITTPEWGGEYREGSRVLYVSTGVGGLIPFRLNMPGEIVVITLRSKKS